MAREIPVSYQNKFCYNIILRDNFDDLINYVSDIEGNKYRKICIVTDSNVSGLYLDPVVSIFENKYNQVITHVFEAGENHKQLESINGLYKDLIESHFERSDLLVALGGGVVGDMTGFAAATYLRGIDFIQIPTTLLSQVDSSIGGKTGVDYLSFKNMVGAFYMPRLVYINISVLDTLPAEQLSSGMGEVIKHGLIRNKEYYYMLIKEKGAFSGKKTDHSIMEEIVYGSCLVKRDVVEEDPKEIGLRRILNYGHTIGHAVEKLSDFRLFHGQCVAIGMVAAAFISFKRDLITLEEYENIKDLLISYKLPVKIDREMFNFTAEEILASTKSDKKMIEGRIRFILLKRIGEACIDDTVSDEEILEAAGEIL